MGEGNGHRNDFEFVRGELSQLRKDNEMLNRLFEEHKEARTEDNKALIQAIQTLTGTCADLSSYIRNFNVKLDAVIVMNQKFAITAIAIMGAVFIGKEAIHAVKEWILP